jgi:hypothetical protein
MDSSWRELGWHNNGDGFIHEECVKEDYSGDRLEGVLGEL